MTLYLTDGNLKTGKKKSWKRTLSGNGERRGDERGDRQSDPKSIMTQGTSRRLQEAEEANTIVSEGSSSKMKKPRKNQILSGSTHGDWEGFSLEKLRPSVLREKRTGRI